MKNTGKIQSGMLGELIEAGKSTAKQIGSQLKQLPKDLSKAAKEQISPSAQPDKGIEGVTSQSSGQANTQKADPLEELRARQQKAAQAQYAQLKNALEQEIRAIRQKRDEEWKERQKRLQEAKKQKEQLKKRKEEESWRERLIRRAQTGKEKWQKVMG